MRTASAKQKGRRLQQDVSKALLNISNGLESDDIRSASMGAPGEDILLSPAARKQFPFSIECKNVEKLSIWSAIEQARTNCRAEHTPLIAFCKNHEDIQVSLPMNKFLEIYEVYLRNKDVK